MNIDIIAHYYICNGEYFVVLGIVFAFCVNHLVMINPIQNFIIFKPILKQNYRLKLKPLNCLESIHIFAMPSKIHDKDIVAMFKGVLNLMREQVKQEQTEKYLNLKLKYERLKYLYNKSKQSN